MGKTVVICIAILLIIFALRKCFWNIYVSFFIKEYFLKVKVLKLWVDSSLETVDKKYFVMFKANDNEEEITLAINQLLFVRLQDLTRTSEDLRTVSCKKYLWDRTVQITDIT